MVIASAHEGARAAIEKGRDLEDARGIARATVEQAAGGVVDDLTVAVSASVQGTHSIVGVRVTGRLDTAGPLPMGLPVDVTARATRETEMTRDQRGQALVETILLGLVLLVPLVWTLMVLSEAHRAALGATAAAREAGFEAARSAAPAEAARVIDHSVGQALADHGLDPARARVRWSTPGNLQRGSSVEVEISYPVPLLAVPLLGRITDASLWIRAGHVARIDPYRSRDADG